MRWFALVLIIVLTPFLAAALGFDYGLGIATLLVAAWLAVDLYETDPAREHEVPWSRRAWDTVVGRVRW